MGVAQSDWGEEGYYPMVAIGLGTNSTILNVLKNSGKIVSRSWSYFYGLVGGSSRMNGELVFGGYNAARVSGDSSEHSMSSPSSLCPTRMIVTVTGMALRFANGTRTSIMGSSDSSALSVCLNPTSPGVMKMPLNPWFGNFMTATDNSIYSMNRTLGLYYYNMRYPAQIDPYDGDFIFTLDTGLSITVPNDLLVVPHSYIDQDTGDIIAEDTTEPDLLFDSLQNINENDMAVFGNIFFSAAYLMANYDAEKFTLWAASTTGNSSDEIRAVDTDNAEITSFCEDGDTGVESNSTASTPTTSSGSSATAAAGDKEDGLATGAVAGISVGVVVAAVGLIVGLGLCWVRKRNRTAAYKAAELEDSSSPYSNKSSPSGHHQSQLSGSHAQEVTFELQDARSEGIYRPELHEDSVHKYEMPDSAPPVRYEL
ncbi:hypothetical protein diail_2707 [Diaporthe ilicicola]|nr:hypothetical protein diail_2707 [Diaporthe ilicicola]